MNADGDVLVLQNRVSWNRFDKIRKAQSLRGRKRKSLENENEPTRKRRHGCTSAIMSIDKERLIEEARTWQHDQKVNWSQLGLKYGLSTANRGQIIKEYLAEQGIPVAQTKQHTARAQRRFKKRLPGGKVSFPMYKPVKKMKDDVSQKNCIW